MRKLKIILDRAHGTNIPGKCSPDRSSVEWEWSDARCKSLFNKLKIAGFDVVNIITETIDPKDHLKRIDANCGPAPTLLISLHNNAAGCGKWMNARGYSVWTSRVNSKSDKFATILFETFRKELPEVPYRVDNSDGDPDWEENFNVLVRKPYAILIEWLFQDNKEDVKLLLDNSINERYENAVVNALLEIEKTI